MSETRRRGSRAAKQTADTGRVDPILEHSEIAEPVAPYHLELPPSLPVAISRQVLQRLGELETAYGQQGRSLSDLGSAEELAERMIATVPAPSPWSELGPFYGTTRVAKLLGGISRQAIADRRQRATLLGLKTADGAWVYPELQFDDRHAVIEGLPKVWKILTSSSVDEWTLASWLTSPMRSLEGRSPIEWLRRGEDRETLLDVTRDAAHRFAQ